MITKRPDICGLVWHHELVQTTVVNRPVFRTPWLSPVLYKFRQAYNKDRNVATKVLMLLISLLVIKSFLCLHEYVLCLDTEGSLSNCWLIEFKDNKNWQKVRGEHWKTSLIAIFWCGEGGQTAVINCLFFVNLVHHRYCITSVDPVKRP